MKQNIYQQRILQWEKQYGNLSLHAQKKLKNLLEEFEKTQAISKTSKELRLAIGTKLIRDYQGNTITVIVIQEGFLLILVMYYLRKLYFYLNLK